MEQVVVDSCVLVGSLLQDDALHQRSQPYVSGLESGDYIFHLPTLVAVEVVAAIRRRAPTGWQALLAGTKLSLKEWESGGKIALYPLDRDRMDQATGTAQLYGLRGPDAVLAALSEELDLPLKTFDREVLARFPQASE
jgi:predicted nucleic acid-binding protein